jgi:hypothetical protein
VLFLIDGKRSADEVRSLARQAGSSDSCFDELIELGMISLAEPGPPATPAAEPSVDVDIPIETPAAAVGPAVAGPVEDAEESLLPAARTLQPESLLTDSMLGDAPISESMLAHDDAAFDAAGADADRSLEEARGILLRAVRSEAPLAGSLTILRLRRARSRSELAGLIDEVEARIIKPYRSLAAQQTLRRARQLLVSPAYEPAQGR